MLSEVRQTIFPPRDGPHGLLPPLLLGMTVVTGLVDAFSYLTLGHVFVANMTGNVVFLAFGLLDSPALPRTRVWSAAPALGKGAACSPSPRCSLVQLSALPSSFAVTSLPYQRSRSPSCLRSPWPLDCPG